MTKTIIDTDHQTAAGRRAAQYARIEADRMPRPQTQDLQKRARTPDGGKRMKEFVKFDRRDD